MNLRRLTNAGLVAFREYLAKAREQPDLKLPAELLDHVELTEVVTPEVVVEQRIFVTKGDAAHYLRQALHSWQPEILSSDAGLWSWLSILYFDSICPLRDGRRVVRNDYHYVFEPTNARHYYRHLLFVSWRMLVLAPDYNRLFLSSRVDTLDGVTTEIVKRLYLTRIPAIFETLDRLYWEEARARPRRGITGSEVRPGDLVHRFPLRIRQLEKTYDLMSLNADQLLELLGDEFAFARPKSRSLLPEESPSN